MQLLAMESGTLAFATRGSGPNLLVPWCNLPWPELPVIDRLAARYHVVLASPRGYQRSSRLVPDENYSLNTSAHHLLAVCEAVGVDEFAVLGGFPLLGSYAKVLQSAERDVQQLTGDPGFDPRAALALYRDLAELADGALVDDRQCPMRAFWGSHDIVLQGFDVEPDLAGALTARGVGAAVVAGADHVTTLLDTNAIMSALSATGP